MEGSQENTAATDRDLTPMQVIGDLAPEDDYLRKTFRFCGR